ncbi:hypothetical protein RGL88_000903 [Providencia rettgeri]|nr:hypothetical protein [Providencia rettgeri]
MDTIYSLLILFVLYCIVSDWFMHEYDEKLSRDNFYKFKIGSFFSYQLPALKRLVNLNEESLAKQPIFWIGIIIPFIAAFWLEYQIILLNPELLSFDRLEDFFKASSSSLYISALIPTLGVIISNIHKSIQTEKQIYQSEIKGRIDSFNAHYKFITDRIDEIQENDIGYAEKNSLFIKSNLIIVYRAAFPNSTLENGYNGEPTSQSYIKRIINIIEELTKIAPISLDEIIKLKMKKNEVSKIKNIEKIIFTKERKKTFIHLMVGIGLEKNKESYIDFYDENGKIKNEIDIISEYSTIYIKLHYYIFLLLKVLNIDNASEIAKPCIDISKKINDILREYSNTESTNKGS